MKEIELAGDKLKLSLSVDDEGVVKGLQVSSDPVTITATANDGSGVYASIDITVVEGSGESIVPPENEGTYYGYDDTDSFSLALTLTRDGNMSLIIEYMEVSSTEFELVSFDGSKYNYSFDGQSVTLEIKDSSTVSIYFDTEFVTYEGNYIYCLTDGIVLTKN